MAAIQTSAASVLRRNPVEPITELVNGTFRVYTTGSLTLSLELDRPFNNFEQLEAVSAVSR